MFFLWVFKCAKTSASRFFHYKLLSLAEKYFLKSNIQMKMFDFNGPCSLTTLGKVDKIPILVLLGESSKVTF